MARSIILSLFGALVVAGCSSGNLATTPSPTPAVTQIALSTTEVNPTSPGATAAGTAAAATTAAGTAAAGTTAAATTAAGTTAAGTAAAARATVATTTLATTSTAAAATIVATTQAPKVSTSPASSGAAASDPTAGRPYDVFVPSTYNGSSALPLVMSLHGYTSSGALQDRYFNLQPLAEERGFFYIHPDGTKDVAGNRFWNATDSCCDLRSTGIDDVAYLTAIIDQASQKYRVDPKRVYVVGHSNGGFMSYRMACDRSDRIAAIVSLAGSTFADTKRCNAAQPVSVLQVHGTSDGVIPYRGGQIQGHPFPAAEQTVSTWATIDGCSATPSVSATTRDLDTRLEGAESTASTFSNCEKGTSVDLWTINGGAHSPELSPAFSSGIIDFLYDHPKA